MNPETLVHYHLPFGIEIKTDGQGGGVLVKSQLDDALFDESDDDQGSYLMQCVINALESLVLAHACAGIKIDGLAYTNGLETAVKSVLEHIG